MGVETWLRANARALYLGMLLPAVFVVLGLVLACGLPGREPAAWMRIGGGALALVSLWVIVALGVQARLPRLAYSQGELLVRLRAGPPIRLPIDVVECFWLGQAASLLPGKQHQKTEAASVVIRLAERATEWRHQEVKPQLGLWCEGYVTIRGTWCEPLSIDVVNRLNQRLSEVAKERTNG